MRIVIFDDEYPDGNNLPGDMFAHTRVRLYAGQAQVLVLRRGKVSRRLRYEGIDIQDYVDSAEALGHHRSFGADIAGVHFAEEPFISEIVPHLERPLIVWVHGIEALAWHTSLYNLRPSDWLPHRLWFRDQRSRLRMRNFSKLIDRSNAGAPIHFVFVSQWMKKMCESSTSRSVRHASTIPNPIDTARFTPTPIADRIRNVLVIRSSDTMKYRPDVVAQIIKRLMKGRSDFRCRIFSDGSLFDKYFAPLAQIPGVEVNRHFIPQDEIAAQHKWGGFFLCPTAQDAQGVSMCEAMASGLIVATTPVTAIPEFASADVAILSRRASVLAKEIEAVAEDEERADRLSRSAAKHVEANLKASAIVGQELDLMRRHAVTALT